VAAEEQRDHLRDFMEGLFPGRWETLRPVTARELKATRLLSLPLDEASAKIRRGPPDEPGKDRNWPAWAGVLPLIAAFGAPAPDEHSQASGLPAPSSERLGSSADDSPTAAGQVVKS
jgi:hypothetical protein